MDLWLGEGGKGEREKKKSKKGGEIPTCEIVSNQRNAHVDEIIEPSRHDGSAAISNNTDKLTLKELISIKENVIGKPCSRRGNQPRSKIRKRKFERLSIIPRHFTLPLRCYQLLTG